MFVLASRREYSEILNVDAAAAGAGASNPPPSPGRIRTISDLTGKTRSCMNRIDGFGTWPFVLLQSSFAFAEIERFTANK